MSIWYWGHNWGVILALDETTNKPLYVAFVKSETTQDYRTAIDSITTAGYMIRGIIIDGKKALFKEFEKHPIQMCQFHMLRIVRRYLTNNPKMKASVALRTRTAGFVTYTERYEQWYAALIFICLTCSLFSVPNVKECLIRITRLKALLRI